MGRFGTICELPILPRISSSPSGGISFMGISVSDLKACSSQFWPTLSLPKTEVVRKLVLRKFSIPG